MLFSFLNQSFGFDNTMYMIVFAVFAVLCIAVPYLIGSLNFAVIISKVFYRDDIRRHGSGNAGATNMLRTYGKLPAAATMILDMLKCVFSIAFCILMLPAEMSNDPQTSLLVCSFDPAYIGGLACILGHMFPCFYKFKGGKGVASVAMMILCTSPFLFLVLVVCFLVIVLGTKFVSLASVMSMALYPLLLHSLGYPLGAKGFPVLIAFIVAALIIFMHRENIKRIMDGTESKISLSKKSKKNEDSDNE